MNFGLTEEQELLRKTARDLLAERAPMAHVREILEGQETHSATLWKHLAELGWSGLMLPERYGGAGLSIVELCIVLEELGRRLVPVPFLSTAMAACALLECADEAQQGEWLPGIAAGEKVATLALPSLEPDAAEQAFDVVPDDGGYRLSGEAPLVLDAAAADLFVAPARFADGAAGLFAVPRRAAGVGATPRPGLDRLRPPHRVRFDGVALPATALLGGRHGADAAARRLRRVLDRALVMLSAEMVGGAEACLDASVAYAKQRVQFGKPIGVHQAIKHKCADMLFGVESARSITFYAAWAAREDAPDASTAAAMAKATASDAFCHAAQENLQIHGGVGFTWEYDCHLYLRRAKSDEALLGDAGAQRERIATLLSI